MLSDDALLKSFPNMNHEASRKLFVLIGFLGRSRYILEKLFSREPSDSIVLGQKFRLWIVIETHFVFKKLKLVNNWSVLYKIYFPCKNVKCHSRWYCVLKLSQFYVSYH